MSSRCRSDLQAPSLQGRINSTAVLALATCERSRLYRQQEKLIQHDSSFSHDGMEHLCSNDSELAQGRVPCQQH